MEILTDNSVDFASGSGSNIQASEEEKQLAARPVTKADVESVRNLVACPSARSDLLIKEALEDLELGIVIVRLIAGLQGNFYNVSEKDIASQEDPSQGSAG